MDRMVHDPRQPRIKEEQSLKPVISIGLEILGDLLDLGDFKLRFEKFLTSPLVDENLGPLFERAELVKSSMESVTFGRDGLDLDDVIEILRNRGREFLFEASEIGPHPVAHDQDGSIGF